MRCYYHAEVPAVGICKSCAKGLCVNCQVDLGHGLACKDRCEEEVRLIHGVTDQAIRQMPVTHSLLASTKLYTLLTGSFFVLMGVGMITFDQLKAPNPGFLTMMGALMASYGLTHLVRGLRLKKVASIPRTSCQQCSFDLTGNTSRICPECGTDTDRP